MCCSNRRQQRHLELQQLRLQTPVQTRQRGCCGARRQRRLLDEAAVDTQNHSQVSQVPHLGYFDQCPRTQRPTMAGFIAVGIGLGVEKLGRKISEKRLEKKEKKSAAVWISSRVLSHYLPRLASLDISLTNIRNARPSMVPLSLRRRVQFRIDMKAGMKGDTGRVKRRDMSKSLPLDGGV